MAVETAVLEWLKWDTATTYKSPGLLSGGEVYAESDMAIRRGSSNQASFFAGPVTFGGSATMLATLDTKALVQKAVRAAGVLTALNIYGGTAAVDLLHAGSLIKSLRASGRVDEPMECSIDWLALTETEAATGGAPVALTSDLFSYGGAAVTIGASPFKCQGWELSLNNNLQHYRTLDAKSATTKRLPTGITPGTEEIEFSADFLDKHTWDVDEDAPAVNLGAIVAYTDGANSITFTLTNLARRGRRSLRIETESGLIIWRYQFIAKPGALAIT